MQTTKEYLKYLNESKLPNESPICANGQLGLCRSPKHVTNPHVFVGQNPMLVGSTVLFYWLKSECCWLDRQFLDPNPHLCCFKIGGSNAPRALGFSPSVTEAHYLQRQRPVPVVTKNGMRIGDDYPLVN